MELTATQKQILAVFKASALKDLFYWSGGTVLAHYYLRHRISLDLDFFSEQPFVYGILEPFLVQLKRVLHLDVLEPTKIYDRWEFLIKTPELTRFEFVYYDHDKKRLAPLEEKDGIKVDSLTDLAANKVIAYLDRNEPKDLFDLYILLANQHFSLIELLDLVEKKFGLRVSEFQFWSESTKSLKSLKTLQPYLPKTALVRGKGLYKNIEQFFLTHGSDYIEKELADR